MRMNDDGPVRRRAVKKVVRTGGNTPATPVTTRRPMMTGGNTPASRVLVKRTGGNTPATRVPGNTGVVPPHMRRSSMALDRLGKKPRKGY